ncbi:MAG TPA: trehalose-phosphatase [Gemmataceae bacterium]|nr:trehalose-phosphatase [Gemmataceae bacterium]
MCQPLFDDIHDVQERIAQATHVLVCLDYDGTLTHFTAHPIGAHLSPHMERVLMSLAEHGHATLAIVSGRDRNDLQNRVGIPGVTYVGNHGLEISGPGYLFVEPMSASHVAAFQALTDQLSEELQSINGVIVENKGLTISVHYRQVHQGEWAEVGRRVAVVLSGASYGFVMTRGEKVFEIRPAVGWNKGNALHWIEQQLAKPGMLMIYVGDDVTDEDAFRAIPDGITVKVGDGSATAARYKLEGTADVRKFVEWLDEELERKALHHAEALAEEVDMEATIY